MHFAGRGYNKLDATTDETAEFDAEECDQWEKDRWSNISKWLICLNFDQALAAYNANCGR